MRNAVIQENPEARPNDIYWTADKQRCWELLEGWCGGDHRMQPVRHWGFGLAMRWKGDVATYDGDMLTWLVLLAHSHCCRVAISPHSPGYVRVEVWARKPNGGRSQRHPDLLDLMLRCRNMVEAAKKAETPNAT